MMDDVYFIVHTTPTGFTTGARSDELENLPGLPGGCYLGCVPQASPPGQVAGNCQDPLRAWRFPVGLREGKLAVATKKLGHVTSDSKHAR